MAIFDRAGRNGRPLTARAILNRPLMARSGERVGRVRDLVAHLPEGANPWVSGLVASVGNQEFFVPLQEVQAIDPDGVLLQGARLDVRPFERRPGEILLARDLLGRHVIHVDRARLVRADDVALQPEGVRMQVEGVVSDHAGPLRRIMGRDHGEHRELVDWSHIEPLVGHVPAVRRLPFARLARLHPAELADMVEAASPTEGEEILQAVGADRALEADVFEELEPDYQVEFLQDRPDREVADILGRMNPDDAADLLLHLEEEHRQRVMPYLPLPQLRKVRMLLGYHPETAGGLMSPDFLALPMSITAAEAMQWLRESELPPALLSSIYLLDEDDRLAGVLGPVELFRREGTQPIGEGAERDPVAVGPQTDVPGVARRMADFNLSALPVVDEQHRLLGVVTVDDLLEVMLPEDWRALTGGDEQVRRGRDEQGL